MLHRFSNGLLGANAYLVWNEHADGNPGFVLDLGVPPQTVKQYADEKGVTVKSLILSHGHYDHAHYAAQYRAMFPAAEYLCHAAEDKILCDPEANVSAMCYAEVVYPLPDRTLADGDTVTLGEGETADVWTVIHTPGHTPGCICLWNKTQKKMLTGDTLFADGGFGRYDFKYGDAAILGKSLARLLAMDAEILIYPGHGLSSTIGEERPTLSYFGRY